MRRIIIFKNTDHNQYSWRYGEIGTWVNIKWCKCKTVENGMERSQKLNKKMVILCSSFICGHIPKRSTARTRTRPSSQQHYHTSSKVVIPCPLTIRMDKQMGCIETTEDFFSFKKEENSSSCYNMDESGCHYAKGHTLYDSTYTRALEQASSWRHGVGWGTGVGEGRGSYLNE